MKNFLEKKKLLEIEAENNKKLHEYHMEELEFKKTLEMLQFQHALELQRIKSAEIKKTIDRKANIDFMKNGR